MVYYVLDIHIYLHVHKNMYAVYMHVYTYMYMYRYIYTYTCTCSYGDEATPTHLDWHSPHCTLVCLVQKES